MTKTYFKPSIHGWPFINSFPFQYTLLFETVNLKLGFCGGMCWTSLQRFYDGICIPRDIAQPQQGESLYNEIFIVQEDSLPMSTLWQIYAWQTSPDQSHWNRKHSLGYRTQQEWPKVKTCLDNSLPVTLTLLNSSNDGNPQHLENTHRVIAYAYNMRPFYPGEGAPSGSTTPIDLFIYDPIHPNDDDVFLTFYLGGDNNKIGLRHNKGFEVHGFFLDDKDRTYASTDITRVQIIKCLQTNISEASFANYDFEFSWQCPFIPYFDIQIDDIDWKNNSSLQNSLNPVTDPYGVAFINKQCQNRVGSTIVNLRLPRALSKVAVRLLDTDEFYSSLKVDAIPYIECYPYVNIRASGNGPQVWDLAFRDTDLFIKEATPLQADVNQLDDSPFRWIINDKRQHITHLTPHSVTKSDLKSINIYSLGNIVNPILANFVLKNLATPIQISGIVKITKNGIVQTINLPSLNNIAQNIFDGFKDNSADYDNNTTVEFTFVAKDKYNLIVQGHTTFYGKSIIDEKRIDIVQGIDPYRAAELEEYIKHLVERELVEITINLTHPVPPVDPFVLLNKVRSQLQLKDIINKTIKNLWDDPSSWTDCKKIQSEILNQKEDEEIIKISKPIRIGEILDSLNKEKETEQRKFDSALTDVIADKTIKKLSQDLNVVKILKFMTAW